jgi:hypothetical protein
MIKTSKKTILINILIKTIKIEIKKSITMEKKKMMIFRIKDNINNIKIANIEKIINMRIFKWKTRRNSINLMIGPQTSSIILQTMITEEIILDLEVNTTIIRMNKAKDKVLLK